LWQLNCLQQQQQLLLLLLLLGPTTTTTAAAAAAIATTTTTTTTTTHYHHYTNYYTTTTIIIIIIIIINLLANFELSNRVDDKREQDSDNSDILFKKKTITNTAVISNNPTATHRTSTRPLHTALYKFRWTTLDQQSNALHRIEALLETIIVLRNVGPSPIIRHDFETYQYTAYNCTTLLQYGSSHNVGGMTMWSNWLSDERRMKPVDYKHQRITERDKIRGVAKNLISVYTF